MPDVPTLSTNERAASVMDLASQSMDLAIASLP